MPDTSRQERRKQRTTDAILDAAETLFSQRGYAASTVDAIADAADVAIGSIYARFEGKEGLYLALVERLVSINEAYIAEALSIEGSPLERVLAAGDAYLRFHRDHPLAFRLVGLRDLERSDGEPRGRIAQRLQAMLDAIASALAEAVAAGETAALEPHATATFLWGAWNGTLALHARGLLDDDGVRETLTAGTALIARGLATG